MHNREERLFYIDLASEQPDMTKEQELVFYKENAIHNKEELLGTIQEAKEVLCAKERNAKRRSEVCISRLEKLFDRFYADVQTMFLMELSDWWGYGISVRETGISLKLCHFAVLYDFNRDPTDDYPTQGQLVPDEDYTLHCTSSKLLSLEEFGMIHDVAADTVRQWIRRGKIRSAVKMGNDWRIPELSDLPERGYKPGSYYWREEIPNPPEEVPDINSYDEVSIFPAEGKGNWCIKFTHEYVDDDPNRKILIMDNKQKEKFELFLLAHPLVRCPNNYLGEIYQKHPKKYFLVEPRELPADFFDGVDEE